MEQQESHIKGLIHSFLFDEHNGIYWSKRRGKKFDSQQYNKVLNMGGAAMKPLYWIIYKSPNAGMYEYICATALYELSGCDFTNEDGSLTWTNSKEFLDRFNEKILSDRKR